MDVQGILGVFVESLKVCAFVGVMMTLIEALNLESHGRIFRAVRKSRIGQVGLGAALGIIPGCVGGFAVTSLYNHGLLSFGALVAMMIASSGDEAFVMLSMFPRKALCIMGFLLVLAFVVGLFVDRMRINEHQCDDIDISPDEDAEHCHHLPRVFAWTFSVLLLITFLGKYVDVEAWISDNTALMIVLAALVGIIPESGPHLIFVTLFAQGVLPLPVLLTSCISQDGHSGLPLLAENKRSFFVGKAINVAVAILIGFVAMWIF